METNHKSPDALIRGGAESGKDLVERDRPAPGDSTGQLLISAEFPATMVIDAYTTSHASPAELIRELRNQAERVNKGNLSAVEALLINQAVTLQSIFADLAVRAKKEKSWIGIQTLTQLALRSQSNCRATLEALVEIKSPKHIAFVRQTNVAQTQQVNNGVDLGSGSKIPRKKKSAIGAKQTISEDI